MKRKTEAKHPKLRMFLHWGAKLFNYKHIPSFVLGRPKHLKMAKMMWKMKKTMTTKTKSRMKRKVRSQASKSKKSWSEDCRGSSLTKTRRYTLARDAQGYISALHSL